MIRPLDVMIVGSALALSAVYLYMPETPAVAADPMPMLAAATPGVDGAELAALSLGAAARECILSIGY